jgi:hypothetical protein
MTPQIAPTAGTLPWLGILAAVAFLVFVAVIAYALAKSAAGQWGEIDQGEGFGEGDYR